MLSMRRARYICLEGTEGVGKTTQTQKLVDYLRAKSYKVLQTKEPGTNHAPLTMVLRGIMLDKQYDAELTVPARELVSQAIRSIHLEKVIAPAMNQYDFIIQDRGVLSGWAYGTACGNDFNTLTNLTEYLLKHASSLPQDERGLYSDVIYLTGNTSASLQKALAAKQEFVAGDAMEAKGTSFMEGVARNMTEMATLFNARVVNVDGKGIDEVFTEILHALRIEG